MTSRLSGVTGTCSIALAAASRSPTGRMYIQPSSNWPLAKSATPTSRQASINPRSRTSCCCSVRGGSPSSPTAVNPSERRCFILIASNNSRCFLALRSSSTSVLAAASAPCWLRLRSSFSKIVFTGAIIGSFAVGLVVCFARVLWINLNGFQQFAKSPLAIYHPF